MDDQTLDTVGVATQAAIDVIVEGFDLGKPPEDVAVLGAGEREPAHRRGVVRGQCQGPDDADTLSAAEVEAMVYGQGAGVFRPARLSFAGPGHPPVTRLEARPFPRPVFEPSAGPA